MFWGWGYALYLAARLDKRDEEEQR